MQVLHLADRRHQRRASLDGQCPGFAPLQGHDALDAGARPEGFEEGLVDRSNASRRRRRTRRVCWKQARLCVDRGAAAVHYSRAREPGGGRVRRPLIVPSWPLACVLVAPPRGGRRGHVPADHRLRGPPRRRAEASRRGERRRARALADGRRLRHVRRPRSRPRARRQAAPVTGPASATAGVPLLGWCFGSVTWTGHAEILARPELGHDWQLRFRDVDFHLYNAARQPATVATRLWTVVRDWSAAELETFSYDLGPPVEEVRALLRSFSTPTGGLVAALQTLRPRELAVEPDAVRLRVSHRPASGTARPGRSRAGPDPRRDPAVGGPRWTAGTASSASWSRTSPAARIPRCGPSCWTSCSRPGAK